MAGGSFLFGRRPVPPQWADERSYLIPAPAGMVALGNINLWNRPQVRTPGGTATVHSMSYGTDQGEILIPTVSNEGRMMNPDQAQDYWRQRGQFLGIFATPDDADAYGKALHDQQEIFYGLGPKAKGKAKR